MEPVQIVGATDGEAGIEVHHQSTTGAEKDEGHETRFNDLQCLCPNCHRYRHRIMSGRC